jgi:hypothetical protein
MSPTKLMTLAAALALAPLGADAQSQSTYRCQGTDGKKYYGNTVPPQCYGRLVEQLNSQGMVIRRIDPEANEKDAALKEAEREQKAKLDAATRESTRRDRALLATYTSEKDIEEQRTRALADNQKAVREAEVRVNDLKKKRAGYDKELEFYNDKKGKTKPPAKLTEEIRQADFDLKVQEETLEKWKREVVNINAKYDDDKKRYQILSGKNPAQRAAALGMEKGVTVTTKGPNTWEEQRAKSEAQQRAQRERYEVQRIEAEQEAARRRAVYDQQYRQQQQQRR